MPRMKMNIAALSLEITKATHSEIQLFPAGEFSAVDGRPYTDEVESGKWVLTAGLAAQLVAQVAARTTPFVIDYEHQTLRAQGSCPCATCSALTLCLPGQTDNFLSGNATLDHCGAAVFLLLQGFPAPYLTCASPAPLQACRPFPTPRFPR